PAGMCGVETLAPLMLHAVNQGKISLLQLVKVLSAYPAQLFGIYPQKGSLQVGTDAVLTIIDLNKNHSINKEKLHSKGKVTAYDSFEVTGLPVATIVRGKTIMQDGEVVTGPQGRLVKPENERNSHQLK